MSTADLQPCLVKYARMAAAGLRAADGSGKPVLVAIVDSALELWVGLALHDPRLLLQFFEHRDVASVLQELLFCSEESAVRLKFMHRCRCFPSNMLTHI